MAQKELDELDLDGSITIETKKPTDSLVLDGSTLYYFDEEFSLPAFLHELLHIEMARLNRLPRYYEDALIVSLHEYLTSEVEDLQCYLQDCLCLPEQEGRRTNDSLAYEDPVEWKLSCRPQGLLFLLKSIELDLRYGWEPGTVWSRGESDFDHMFEPDEEAETDDEEYYED